MATEITRLAHQSALLLAYLAVMCSCGSGASHESPTGPTNATPPIVQTADNPSHAELAIISCDALMPNWKAGQWRVGVTVEIAGGSPELVIQLGEFLDRTIVEDPAAFASVREQSGVAVPLAGTGSSWLDRIKAEGGFSPRVNYRSYKVEDLGRTIAGGWSLRIKTGLVCEVQPTGTVTIALNGEAIRRGIAEWLGSGPIMAVPAGGLSSKPAEVVIPAVTMPDPPTAGAGITSGP